MTARLTIASLLLAGCALAWPLYRRYWLDGDVGRFAYLLAGEVR